MYKVRVYDNQGNTVETICNLMSFESLKEIYSKMFGENEDEMNYLYDNEAEEGYDILLPCIGYVNASTIARELFPEQFKIACDKICSELAEKAETFFKDCETDEELRISTGGELYNSFNYYDGGFVISKEE